MRPVLFLLLVARAVVAEPVTHVVDLGRHYQVIDHFGASDCWTTRILGAWSRESREKIADLLFSPEGIGLSLWRFNLGAGLQPDRIKDPLRTTESFETARRKYDWSRMKTERAMLLAAKARGAWTAGPMPDGMDAGERTTPTAATRRSSWDPTYLVWRHAPEVHERGLPRRGPR